MATIVRPTVGVASVSTSRHGNRASTTNCMVSAAAPRAESLIRRSPARLRYLQGLDSRRATPCRVTVLRAHKDDSEKKTPDPSIDLTDKDPEESTLSKKDEIQKLLQAQGVTETSAKEILKLWEQMGVQSVEDMRKLLTKRGRSAVIGVTVQTLVDVATTWAAASAGFSFGAAGGWNVIPSFFSYSLASYFALNAVLGTITLASMLGSGALFGTDAEALVRAVKEIAGDEEQVGLLAKTKQTVNMLKIVQTLNKVSDKLKEGSGSLSSLDTLSAYLTLSRAEKEYGFDPTAYNMSEAEAMKIAGSFSRFDLNDDGALELSEFEKMLSDLGCPMNTEELQAVIDVLDVKKTGVVEFDEFVEWYTNKLPEPTAAGVGHASGAMKEEVKQTEQVNGK